MRFNRAFHIIDRVHKAGFIRVSETLLALAVAKFGVKLVPLKKMVPFLGEQGGKEIALSTEQLQVSKAIGELVRSISSRVPWRSVCLDQAIATMILLRRRRIPYRLCFGTRLDLANEKLLAHAWLEYDQLIFIGDDYSKQYNVVLFFTKASYG